MEVLISCYMQNLGKHHILNVAEHWIQTSNAYKSNHRIKKKTKKHTIILKQNLES